jgi:4-amino-4-deoxy-L-arabinose transferase-like glycosyltransferase
MTAAGYRERLASGNGGRRGLALLGLVLLVGLGLRLGYAWDPWDPQDPDAQGYARIAASLERFGTFSQQGNFAPSDIQPASNYSPGLPLLVAGVYKLSGGVNPRLARLVLAMIGSLAVLFTYLLGRRLRGPPAGLIAAAPIAVYPALLQYQGMFMTEPLAATLLCGGLLAFFWAGDRDSPLAYALPGVLLGAMALVRPEYLAFGAILPLLAMVRIWRGGSWRAGAASAAVMLVAFVVPVVPWTIHNALVLDRFVPISTGGGKVLWVGTYLQAEGDGPKARQELLEHRPALRRKLAQDYQPRFPSNATAWELFALAKPLDTGIDPAVRFSQRLPYSDFIEQEKAFNTYAHHVYPDLPVDSALSRLGKENLERNLRDHPVAYGGLLAQKSWFAWYQGARHVMLAFPWWLLHALIVIFGLVGLIVSATRRRWEAIVVMVVALAATALSALLIASPRRVIVILPLIAAFGGVAVTWLAGWLRERRAPVAP